MYYVLENIMFIHETQRIDTMIIMIIENQNGVKIQ